MFMNKRVLTKLCILLAAASIAGGCSSGVAKDNYKAGMKLYAEGKYEDASVKLKEASEKNPDKAEYYISYGMVLIETGEYDAAQSQFDKAVSDKDNQIVRENNKQAFRAKGIAYYEARDYKKALDVFTKAIEIKEEASLNADILNYKAECEQKTGDYQAALDTVNQILKDGKSDDAVYGRKAQIEYLLGDTENALKSFDKAIKKESRNYDLHLGKYFILKDQENEELAQQALEQALKIKPDSDGDYYNQAKIHFFQNQYETAQPELTQALDKGFTEASYYLGQICESRKDYSGAAAAYEAYITAWPDLKTAAVHNQLGMCYMETGDYEKALASFQAGLALNDETLMRTLRRNEIAALEQTADYDTAYEKVQSYLSAYPEDAQMKREKDFIQSRTDDIAKKYKKAKKAA